MFSAVSFDSYQRNLVAGNLTGVKWAWELRCVLSKSSASQQLLPASADPTLLLLKGVHFDTEHQLLLKRKIHAQ